MDSRCRPRIHSTKIRDLARNLRAFVFLLPGIAKDGLYWGVECGEDATGVDSRAPETSAWPLIDGCPDVPLRPNESLVRMGSQRRSLPALSVCQVDALGYGCIARS